MERREEIRVKDVTSVSSQYKHGKGLNKFGLILMIIGIVLFVVSIAVMAAGGAISDVSDGEAGGGGIGAGVILLILGLALIPLGIWIMIKFGKVSRDFYLILTGPVNNYETSCELSASTGAVVAKPKKKRKGFIAKLIRFFKGNKKLKVHIDEDLVMDMMDEVGSAIWELQANA